MIDLADTSVLIALTDRKSGFYDRAHTWLEVQKVDGWATCPITENGFVRISTNPAYPSGQLSIATAVKLIHNLKSQPGYRFVPDDYSLFDLNGPTNNITGHNQVTDLYLVELAKRHGMKLATFDQRTKFLPQFYQPYIHLL